MQNFSDELKIWVQFSAEAYVFLSATAFWENTFYLWNNDGSLSAHQKQNKDHRDMIMTSSVGNYRLFVRLKQLEVCQRIYAKCDIRR